MLYVVEKCDTGSRLDVFISAVCEMSRSAAARLIESGDVTVNGRPSQKRYAVREGDEITVNLPEPEEYEAVAEDIPLDVVYEDSDIIVVNKPEGMVVHPARETIRERW